MGNAASDGLLAASDASSVEDMTAMLTKLPAAKRAKISHALSAAAQAGKPTNGANGDTIKRGELKKVKFGNTDMVVTEVCAGTMTWGSFVDKEEDAYAQLDCIMDKGVNFIDTAELYPVAFNYGKTTEKWIGNWMEKRIAEGKVQRDKLYIATKCNPDGVGGPEGYAKQCHGFSADALMASCKASLERLKTDYIDLYQLHWPSRDVLLFGPMYFSPNKEGKGELGKTHKDQGEPEVFEKQVLAVKALLDAGMIRYWGLSNENAYGITMFCNTCDRLGVPRPVSCQNDFSLVDRAYENETAEAAYRFGVVGLPYGPLAGGVLTGKYNKGSKYVNCGDRPMEKCRLVNQPGFQPRYGCPVAMQAAQKYIELAEQYGITPLELALAWAKQRWYNTSIIIGTTTVKQVEECVNAFTIEELPESLMKAIDLVHEEFRNPAMHYTNKDSVLAAPWLGDQAYAAKDAGPAPA